MTPPILCGTDFSENALPTADTAAALATRCGVQRLLRDAAVSVVCVPDTETNAG